MIEPATSVLSHQPPPPPSPPPSPPPTPTPKSEPISDDSISHVLQLNANGIGNKLTELGVIMERSKVNYR